MIPVSWLIFAAGVASCALGLLALFASGMSTNPEESQKGDKQGMTLIGVGAVIMAASWAI